MKKPMRILTATVAAEGLALKMVPVRTDKPIPKARMMEAAAAIMKLKITKPVRQGEVVVKNLLGLKANLIATRSSFS